MIYLTRLTVTSSYASGVLPALLVMGLGFGMIIAPAINTATAGVRREDSGVASALVNTMQQVGGSIGTVGAEHDRAHGDYQLPGRAPHRPLAPAIAATRGYTWRSRCPPGCSDSARSSRWSCCHPGTGLRNSGTRPQRRLLPLPRDDDAFSRDPASRHQEGQSGESARKPQRADYRRVPHPLSAPGIACPGPRNISAGPPGPFRLQLSPNRRTPCAGTA
jgi:hypothetical protein